ncbi:hypothetical protein ES703_105012 [subsurface metagenome]
MFKRIDHVEIVPGDFEKSLNFYTEILGFEIQMRLKVDRPPLEELIFIKLGETSIEMFLVQNPAPASTEEWQVGCRKIAIEVEDMAQAIAHLKSKGVEIVGDIAAAETPRRAIIKDPDGLSIELLQRG